MAGDLAGCARPGGRPLPFGADWRASAPFASPRLHDAARARTCARARARRRHRARHRHRHSVCGRKRYSGPACRERLASRPRVAGWIRRAGPREMRRAALRRRASMPRARDGHSPTECALPPCRPETCHRRSRVAPIRARYSRQAAAAAAAAQARQTKLLPSFAGAMPHLAGGARASCPCGAKPDLASTPFFPRPCVAWASSPDSAAAPRIRLAPPCVGYIALCARIPASSLSLSTCHRQSNT